MLEPDEMRMISAGIMALLLLSFAGTAKAGLTGTLKLGAGDSGIVFANKAKVPFSRVMKVVTRKVPGKITWMAMENIDGYLFHMATVVQADRTQKVVTVDSGNGKVVSVEPLVEKKKGEKKKEKASFTGTLQAGNAAKTEFPYMAKVSLEKAMKIAERKNPGKFYEVYIYDEGGFLFYGIEIALKGKNQLLKIDVDAGNGKIVNTDKM